MYDVMSSVLTAPTPHLISIPWEKVPESLLILMCLYFIIPESPTAAELSSTTFTLLKAAHQIVASLGTRSLALSSLAALAAETSLSHC